MTQESPIEFFHFVQEVKDYGIFMLDPRGLVLSWNEGARAIKGYEAEDIIGQSYERFYSEEDRARGKPRALLARAISEGRVEDIGWRVRKDGTKFWADVVITAVRDAQGGIRGFIKVTRDLSERRRVDEQLQQSEERLRLLVESVKDYAIFMLDPTGHIATWNTGAQHLKGYTAAEIIGQHFSRFYGPADVKAGRPEHEIEVATATGRYEEEGWRYRKDGTRFWANVVLTAIHDPVTGELRGFAKVTRDLTERREIELAARAAAEEAGRERARAADAEAAMKQRDEFISVAAHELRTPLTALQLKVQGVAHTLKKTGEDGPSVDPTLYARLGGRLDGACRQIDRLSDLVERLLDVSRIVRGALLLEVSEVDLGELVRGIAEDYRESAARAGSPITLDTTERLVGDWDRGRLEQVVVNLVSNAIKYGGGKPIEVRVEATPGRARLVVTDHGLGVRPEDAERIFARFERAVSSQHYGGLGLGLYVTRNIVEAHGGTIALSTALGQGSTFTVELPLRTP